MKNRTCLITGATSGIGRAAALQLAASGFDVIVVGRNRDRGEDVCRKILKRAPARRATFLPCDISSLDSVRGLAGEGADTLVYLATSPDVDACSGEYFFRRRPCETSALARDDRIAQELWRKSERRCGFHSEV